MRAFLGNALRNQEKGGEAHWVLEQRAGRSPIGMFTVWFGEHGAELGFALSRAHWGRGYMTEAGTAIVEALLRDGAWHRIWAYCDCENEASARVLRKLGLGEEARLRRRVVHPNISDKPRDVIVFSRVR